MATTTNMRVTLILALAFIHVGMAEDPRLVLQPSTIQKPLGEGVYVSCSAEVDDPGLVTAMAWSGPDGQPIPNPDGTIKTLEGIGGMGKLDLMIQDLREQDTGEYTCTATYAGNQELTASVRVDAYMNIDFGDTPVLQTPIIDTEAKIRCNPTAMPAPVVDWLKDLKPLTNDENYIIQTDGVLIKKVTEADEGIYRCRARVAVLGSIKYKDIQVEVHIPPEINIPPEDLKGVEKESVTFNCNAKGKPAPSYTWANKDQEALETMGDYFVDKEKGILTILNLKPEHSGDYRCTASNNAGEDTAKANLLVLTKPKVEQFLNLTIAATEDTEFRCIVTGDPAPQIVFQKETHPQPYMPGINTDDRIDVSQVTDEEGREVGIMKIRGVKREDDGLYTCTAKSEGGETQVWGHITVEFPPTFEQQLRNEEWSWEQRPVNLSCLATAIPNATIQWYFRNNPIDVNDQNLVVKSLSPNGILQVTPLSQNYFGVYTCQATNTHGMNEYDIELREAHIPGPISQATVDKVTATTITWTLTDPADNGGLPILGYIVQYRIDNQGWEDSESIFWTKGSSYILDKLVPEMTYVFRFAARSDAGDGEWGGEKSETMLKQAEPEEPLMFDVKPNGVTESVYPNKYSLQWQVPLDNGKPIDHFTIMYYQVHNVSGKWESSGDQENEQVDYPGPSTYTIENVRSDSYYRIELRAHNEIGYSTPAEAVIKTAKDPSAPPGSGPGQTNEYSSVAPSTTTPAYGPNPEEVTDAGIGTGILIAIIVIVLLVIIVVIDLVCYCTKKAGLTATVLGKRGAKDKDEEKMLGDGKNASADTLNEESREKPKPIDEKPVPEKELQKTPEIKAEIKSEKETDEKHEGNGEMKTQKEEEPKQNNQQEPDEKTKDSTEPTETTPMIQGDKDDKEAILKEEQKEKEEEKLKKSGSKSSVTKDSPV